MFSRIISHATLAVLLISATASAENMLDLKLLKDTKGWQMVEEASLNVANPAVFDLKPGKPLLLSNGGSKSGAAYLKTVKEFQDQDVHAQFMVPKDSNSGFYLLGRYEIQVLDSHGKAKVGSGDMGGLYERWRNQKPNAYDGVAPLVNAANPAGQWQDLVIRFRAPRFDAAGKKTEDARFIEVTLNGKVIHKNVAATGPTRANPLAGEAAKGPLSIQGDHGPIVIRLLDITEKDYSSIVTKELPPMSKSGKPMVDMVALGETTFHGKGCAECHTTDHDDKSIKTGPSLFGVFTPKAKEHQVIDSKTAKVVTVPANLFYFQSSLSNPANHSSIQTQGPDKGKAFPPIMPAFSNALLSPTERLAIFDYLLTLNPEGQGGPATRYAEPEQTAPFDPDTAPEFINVRNVTRVYRAQIGRAHSARSINVGQPNLQNFTFDPSTFAIDAIWTGRFIDFRSELTNRGGNPVAIGVGAKAWPATYSGILRPLASDGTPFTSALTDAYATNIPQEKRAFSDLLKELHGKLIGYTTGNDPKISYLIDGSRVDLAFSIGTDGKLSATLEGDLKQPLTFTFPPAVLKDIKVSTGTLDVAKGVWTLTSLKTPATWTATPAQPLPGRETPPRLADIAASPFLWTPETRKMDILPGYTVETARGPVYGSGASPLFEPMGIDFEKDGTPVIGSRSAGIWKIKDNQWQPFALGTYELLGLHVMKDGSIVACQKPELTRIIDSDNDGTADQFVTLTDQYRFNGNYHAYNHGPAVDSKENIHFNLNLQHVLPAQYLAGNPREAIGARAYTAGSKFMGSSGGFRGWSMQYTPAGKTIPIANGMRSPAGLAFSPEDQLYYTENQGEYVATSKFCHVKKGKFYGHPASMIDLDGLTPADIDKRRAELINSRDIPVVLFPHKLVANSPGNPVWDTTSGKFGPFAGQVFVGDQTLSNIHRIQIETVNGVEQGSIMPFATGLPSGPMRLTFSPNGELWVGQTGRGWASRGGQVSALQKFTWEGKDIQAIHHVEATATGFQLFFTQPIPAAERASFTSAGIDSWYYINAVTYGSNETGKMTHPVTAAEWSADGRAVSLTLTDFAKIPVRPSPDATARVYRINLKPTAFGKTASDFQSTAYYTLNALPK